MFSPFLHGLSSSICNLCLQATWNRVSPIPSTMRLQFSPALVGDISVSKACVSLGDDEPFGTSPGSSSKQRFQRSTRVKKGHVLREGLLACGSCSSLTQQTPSIFGKDMHSQDHLIFPSLCWQFRHCCTALMTAQIGRDHRFNRKFSLTLPRTVPRGKRQGQRPEYLWLLHHQLG